MNLPRMFLEIPTRKQEYEQNQNCLKIKRNNKIVVINRISKNNEIFEKHLKFLSNEIINYKL